MQILLTILYFVIFAVVVLALFNFLKIFVFSKININKWVVLVIGAVLFIIPIVFSNLKGTIITPVFSGLFVIFVLWFFDIQQGRIVKKKEKKIEIRPKAKPNRVKHMNNDKK